MLAIEEIKQAVEFADGFESSNVKGELCHVIFNLGFNDLMVYDLFLDRVIQGICKKYECRVYQDWNSYSLIFNGKQIITDHNGTTEGIREAREKAIRFVLKEGV